MRLCPQRTRAAPHSVRYAPCRGEKIAAPASSHLHAIVAAELGRLRVLGFNRQARAVIGQHLEAAWPGRSRCTVPFSVTTRESASRSVDSTHCYRLQAAEYDREPRANRVRNKKRCVALHSSARRARVSETKRSGTRVRPHGGNCAGTSSKRVRAVTVACIRAMWQICMRVAPLTSQDGAVRWS
jgi:hypothetical protein